MATVLPLLVLIIATFCIVSFVYAICKNTQEAIKEKKKPTKEHTMKIFAEAIAEQMVDEGITETEEEEEEEEEE